MISWVRDVVCCPLFLLVTYCTNPAPRPARSAFSEGRDEGHTFTGDKGASDGLLLLC